MSKLRLSDTWLKAHQEPGDYSDLIVSCLKVRVAKSSKKTFFAIRKIKGKTVRMRIGRYPDVRLVEARKRADDFSNLTSLAPIARAREKQNADASSASIAQFITDYLADMDSRGVKSKSQVEGALLTGKYALVPFLVKRAGDMPRASDVTIEDLQAWMARNYARAPNYAMHLRSYLVTSWKWAVRNRYDYRGGARDYGIQHNIADQLPTVPRGKPGNRYLSKEELRTLWHTLDERHPTHRVVKLMIAMGGLRVTEVTRSIAENWQGDWLNLPETKNGRSHTLPITRAAAPIVGRCLELSHPRSPFLFSHPRDPSVMITTTSVSRGVKRLNKTLGFPDWNPRDIRRTMKTHLIDAGVDERWLDIWHNHGQTASVARKHYIRAEYADLKREVAEGVDGFLEEAL